MIANECFDQDNACEWVVRSRVKKPLNCHNFCTNAQLQQCPLKHMVTRIESKETHMIATNDQWDWLHWWEICKAKHSTINQISVVVGWYIITGRDKVTYCPRHHNQQTEIKLLRIQQFAGHREHSTPQKCSSTWICLFLLSLSPNQATSTQWPPPVIHLLQTDQWKQCFIDKVLCAIENYAMHLTCVNKQQYVCNGHHKCIICMSSDFLLCKILLLVPKQCLVTKHSLSYDVWLLLNIVTNK